MEEGHMGQTGNRSVKQHYIPQCYLRQFAIRRKRGHQFAVFDRKTDKSFRANVKDVACQSYFNRIEVDGMDPEELEKAMSEIETNIAARLKSQEAFDASVQEAKRQGAVPADYNVTYDEMKAAFEGGGFRLVLKNTALVSLELQLLDHIMPLLFRRGWHLLRAPEGSGGFITSDRPFFLMWSDPAMRTGPLPPGLALKGTDIYVPISPHLAVVGAFDVANTIEDVDEARVGVANSTMTAGADRQVYARDHEFSYTQTLEEKPRRGNQLISDRRFPRKTTDAHVGRRERSHLANT